MTILDPRDFGEGADQPKSDSIVRDPYRSEIRATVEHAAKSDGSNAPARRALTMLETAGLKGAGGDFIFADGTIPLAEATPEIAALYSKIEADPESVTRFVDRHWATAKMMEPNMLSAEDRTIINEAHVDDDYIPDQDELEAYAEHAADNGELPRAVRTTDDPHGVFYRDLPFVGHDAGAPYTYDVENVLAGVPDADPADFGYTADTTSEPEGRVGAYYAALDHLFEDVSEMPEAEFMDDGRILFWFTPEQSKRMPGWLRQKFAARGASVPVDSGLEAAKTDFQPERAAFFAKEKYDGEDRRKATNPKDAVGSNKASLSTVPLPVLLEVGVAMTEGARKYGRHNFRVMGIAASVYFDAIIRHAFLWWEGEDIDPDSGLSHITKIISSAVVLRDGMMLELWKDDRPPRSPNGWMADLNDKSKALLTKYATPEEAWTEERVRLMVDAQRHGVSDLSS